MKGEINMTVGSVNQCPKFNSVIFGENGKYIATRNGDKVLIRGKDGSIRTTDVDTFMQCLAAALPKIKEQPKADTFIKKLTEMQKINSEDSALTRINKSIHNAGAIFFNPTESWNYMTGKYV